MTCPTGDQQMLAEALVSAGADIIVGSHAHRVLALITIAVAMFGQSVAEVDSAAVAMRERARMELGAEYSHAPARSRGYFSASDHLKLPRDRCP